MVMSTRNVALTASAATLLLGLSCGSARAQLTPSFIWSGNGNWSLDGIGSNNNPVGSVLADVPLGSTVVKAYLYSTIYTYNVSDPSASAPNVSLGGMTYSGLDWTALGRDSSANGLGAYRADVTTQMKAAIGNGSSTPFSFLVAENTNNDGTNGEVLAIAYSNPADPAVTITFFDGSLTSTGATTTIDYASPLSGVGSPGFYEQMSIGIGHSFEDLGAGQYTEINVDGRRLTTSAGGDDDDVAGGANGSGYNGDLITVGGIGDSTANPPDPFARPTSDRSDDELYDLGQGDAADPTPFVSDGDTSTTITTVNPSGDDNVFFLGLNLTTQATAMKGVSDVASTASLLVVALAIGLASLGLCVRNPF